MKHICNNFYLKKKRNSTIWSKEELFLNSDSVGAFLQPKLLGAGSWELGLRGPHVKAEGGQRWGGGEKGGVIETEGGVLVYQRVISTSKAVYRACV